jgi:hypothetical protein
MAIEIARETVIKRDRDVRFTQLDDELLAINADAGYCYSLNETAGRVWELIVEPQTVGAVCLQLAREYSVDEATCLREVTRLLQGLHGAGLVRVVDAEVR